MRVTMSIDGIICLITHEPPRQHCFRLGVPGLAVVRFRFVVIRDLGSS